MNLYVIRLETHNSVADRAVQQILVLVVLSFLKADCQPAALMYENNVIDIN